MVASHSHAEARHAMNRWALAALATAIMLAASGYSAGQSRIIAEVQFFDRCLVLAVVFGAALVDARTRCIPDVFPLAIVLIHTGCLTAIAAVGGNVADPASVGVAGAVVLGGGLFAFTLAYEAVTGTVGMGGGDVKLVAVLGFAFGVGPGAVLLMAACGLFALHMGVRMAASRMRWKPVEHVDAFGPALALAATLVSLCA